MKFTARLCQLLAAMALAGCISPYQDPRIAPPAAPLDFAVQFNVRGAESPSDPLRQNAQFLVQADRKFRAATGQGAMADYFPAPTRILSPREYAGLYELIHGLSLDKEAAVKSAVSTTAPSETGAGNATPDVEVVYEVAITANDRTYRCHCTPGQAPGLTTLLSRLVKLEHDPD